MRLSFVRKWLDQAGGEIAEVNRVHGGYSVCYHGVAEYFVSIDGMESRLLVALSDSPEEIERVHRNQIVPMAMGRQGSLVVHASALDVGGECVAFVGVSGRGKSTLAASFAIQGFPFLTDDGLLVSAVDAVYYGVSRSAILSLRQESKSHFEQIAAASVEIKAYGAKWEIAGGVRMPHCNVALPLSALYFLGEGLAQDVRIVSIRHHEAIQLLLSNTFVLDTTDKVALTMHFRQISGLVGRVPTFLLDYPRRFDFLPTLHAALAKHMRQNTHLAQPVELSDSLPITSEKIGSLA